MSNPRAQAALSRDLRTSRAWVLRQRGKPEHIPAAVREERAQRERIARRTETTEGGEAE